jgi:nuclear transport factor 2 (NTF2) superfamily protein
MPDQLELLKRLYDRFNARDMESVLATMHQDVIWANGMEGGYVHGRDAVRRYWTRQWTMLDPHVEATEFPTGSDAKLLWKFVRSCTISTAYSWRTK